MCFLYYHDWSMVLRLGHIDIYTQDHTGATYSALAHGILTQSCLMVFKRPHVELRVMSHTYIPKIMTSKFSMWDLCTIDYPILVGHIVDLCTTAYLFLLDPTSFYRGAIGMTYFSTEKQSCLRLLYHL